MLFKIKEKKVSIVEEQHFETERFVQNLIENNLPSLFPNLKLTFIKTEFSIDRFRFDSVAFDEENKVFYILEYKNVEKKSLIDQGVAYLKTLLDRKFDFINLLEIAKGITIKHTDIDWAATRVIFISPSYNNYQLKIAELNNAPFSLYKFTKYSNDLFSLEKIENKNTDGSDFNDLIGSIDSEVKKEIKVYTEKDHLDGANKRIIDIYEALKNKILELDNDIVIEPKKLYIAFKGKTNICDLEFYKNNIKVLINLKKGEIDDPFKIANLMRHDDGSKKGHHGNGDYQVVVDNSEKIDKLMFLIKQSYKING